MEIEIKENEPIKLSQNPKFNRENDKRTKCHRHLKLCNLTINRKTLNLSLISLETKVVN